MTMSTAAHTANATLRARLRGLLERPATQRVVIALIMFNAALLGLETWPQATGAAGDLIDALDRVLLTVFVAEIAARLYVHRAAFWRDAWSVFDFVVIAIALVPATGPLAVLRALRVLRVLRLLSIVPSMRRVVGALLAAIPGLGSIALVLLILYYVFAVIATSLFGASHPDWFGHIGRSLYTLFQIMTLESWSMGIARPVMSEFPYAWIFFVAFILVATFTMLNLFIAIIVNAMQRYSDGEPQNAEAMPRDADVRDELRALRAEIERLRLSLHAQGGCGQP
jgi:voltage-gated sodium channel